MTVKELAEELSKLPSDMLVEVWHPDDGWMPALIASTETGTLRLDQDWDLFISTPSEPRKQA